MKPYFIGLLALLACQGTANEEQHKAVEEKTPVFEQSAVIPVVKFDALERLMNSNSDTLYVINFWATWCKPCIEELPYFEQLQAKYAEKPVKVLLISLDFANEANNKVLSFVNKKQVKSSVWLLDEPDANTWIDKIDPSWDGAIPVTLLVNKKQKVRKFIGKEVTWEELQQYTASALE